MFSSLRGFWMCVVGLGLLTTVNATNPTCANTDGTGAAFSSDLCIAESMLRRSDWASAGDCVYSTCKTSDCCVTSSITVGVLTNQVVKTDTSTLDYCSGVAVSPDSKNVYTVSQNSDTLVYWTIDADTQVREHLIVSYLVQHGDAQNLTLFFFFLFSTPSPADLDERNDNNRYHQPLWGIQCDSISLR